MAADAASLRTEMDAMSLGLTFSMLHSTPSTSTRGLLAFVVKDPLPRIRIVAASEPGWPEVCITLIPAAIPARAAEVLTIGLLSARSEKSIAATEPVRLTFFWTPYPTTTVSSSITLSVCKVTLMTFLPLIGSERFLYPRQENCRVAWGSFTARFQFPSASVTVASFEAVITTAPTTGRPSPSMTWPETVILPPPVLLRGSRNCDGDCAEYAK